jgi:DNA-binding NarL/FixJ family response regulator
MKLTANGNGHGPKAEIVIIDDHPIVREGLRQLIDREADLKVIDEAEDGDRALAVIAKQRPDLVLVDISLGNSSGLELIKQLKNRFKKVPILALSMHDEMLYGERVLHAGAGGYVMKGEPKTTLLAAIRRVLKGETYVSERLAESIVSRVAGRKPDLKPNAYGFLSDRELEVFELIGRGQRTSQIAALLCLSVKTINTYREHIKEKLKLKNSMELIQHAIHWAQNKNE